MTLPGRVMNLRTLLAACAVTVLCSSPLVAADSESDSPAIEVWKSATCECCGNWVKHLEANGFAVQVIAADAGTLSHLKQQAGITDKLAACHTAKIDGYVIEGLVPETNMFEAPSCLVGMFGLDRKTAMEVTYAW